MYSVATVETARTPAADTTLYRRNISNILLKGVLCQKKMKKNFISVAFVKLYNISAYYLITNI